MHLNKLLQVHPLPFAVGCWVATFALAVIFNHMPDRGPLAILASLLGLPILYGYPLWVVLASGLGATANAKRMALLPLLALIVLVFVLTVYYPASPTDVEPQFPSWMGVFGGLIAVSLFLPFVAAARTLKAAELRRDIRRQAGGVTAFLWFVYFFLGWAPLHKRVRLAAGVSDRDAN